MPAPRRTTRPTVTRVNVYRPTAAGALAIVDTFSLPLNDGLDQAPGRSSDPSTFAERLRHPGRTVLLDASTNGLLFGAPLDPDDHGFQGNPRRPSTDHDLSSGPFLPARCTPNDLPSGDSSRPTVTP